MLSIQHFVIDTRYCIDNRVLRIKECFHSPSHWTCTLETMPLSPPEKCYKQLAEVFSELDAGCCVTLDDIRWFSSSYTEEDASLSRIRSDISRWNLEYEAMCARDPETFQWLRCVCILEKRPHRICVIPPKKNVHETMYYMEPHNWWDVFMSTWSTWYSARRHSAAQSMI